VRKVGEVGNIRIKVWKQNVRKYRMTECWFESLKGRINQQKDCDLRFIYIRPCGSRGESETLNDEMRLF
jgi:hypothetical protein